MSNDSAMMALRAALQDRGKRLRIVLDHRASRWDRSPLSLRLDIARSALAGAHVISLTEVADGKRPEAVHQAAIAQGYHTLQRTNPWQAGECAILVKEAWAEVLDYQVAQIGPDLGPGNAVYAIVAVVRIIETNQRLLVAECHLPSSVQDKWKAKRGGEFRKMVRNYRRLIKVMRLKWKPDAECVWADWNLDINLAWVAEWANKAFKNLKQISKGKRPDKGTHGPRLIDWPLTRHLSKRVLVIMAQTGGSDHRGARLRARMPRSR